MDLHPNLENCWRDLATTHDEVSAKTVDLSGSSPSLPLPSDEQAARLYTKKCAFADAVLYWSPYGTKRKRDSWCSFAEGLVVLAREHGLGDRRARGGIWRGPALQRSRLFSTFSMSSGGDLDICYPMLSSVFGYDPVDIHRIARDDRLLSPGEFRALEAKYKALHPDDDVGFEGMTATELVRYVWIWVQIHKRDLKGLMHLAPPKTIDKAWHAFALCTNEYASYCLRAYQTYIPYPSNLTVPFHKVVPVLRLGTPEREVDVQGVSAQELLIGEAFMDILHESTMIFFDAGQDYWKGYMAYE